MTKLMIQTFFVTLNTALSINLLSSIFKILSIFTPYNFYFPKITVRVDKIIPVEKIDFTNETINMFSSEKKSLKRIGQFAHDIGI